MPLHDKDTSTRAGERMGRQGVAIVVLAAALGAVVGLGAYTFLYAKGYAYLIDDPAACANCHVMQDQYDGWAHSPHRAVAGCNGCHTPRGFVAAYGTKALNGFLHSAAFTTGWFHDPIQIKGFNLDIAEAACRDCHGALVANVDPAGTARAGPHGDGLRCTSCHQDVGHR
jgi:cytochrome c nitrite reductase small subunit